MTETKSFEPLIRLYDSLREEESSSCGCKKWMENLRRGIAENGVYWKCNVCKGVGIFSNQTEIATRIRKEQKAPVPEVCCIELTGSPDCPYCTSATGRS